MPKHDLRSALVALALGAASLPLCAQTPAEEKPTGDTVKLEKFEVSGVPVGQQILPTARPFNSVFGKIGRAHV